MKCIICGNDTIKGTLESPLETVTLTFEKEGYEFQLKNFFKDISKMAKMSPRPLAPGTSVEAYFCPACKKVMAILDV